MTKFTSPPTKTKAFVRWAMTPPQSYAVYLIAIVLVAGVSFYVGTLKPRKSNNLGPPPLSMPRN
jgi:hypothetical protein